MTELESLQIQVRRMAAEKRTLTATCEEQSEHISKLGKQIAELHESKDLCPVCLTWSWAPCDAGDEGAGQRGEKRVLCQCCNDSRIAVLWKGRADKLREACERYGGHDAVCAYLKANSDCDCGWLAALAKGDEKC